MKTGMEIKISINKAKLNKTMKKFAEKTEELKKQKLAELIKKHNK